MKHSSKRHYTKSIILGVLMLWTSMLIVLFVSKSDIFSFNVELKNGSTLSSRCSFTRNKSSSIYEDRRRTLISLCKDVGKKSNSFRIAALKLKSRLFVDRRHKLLLCGLEKVGCTFWKRILSITTGLVTVKNPYDIPPGKAHIARLKTFTGDLTENHLKTYTKVVFVREPYSRLFSAYVNKLLSPNAGYFALRRQIANSTRFRKGPLSTGCAPFVSFRDFVTYVLGKLKRKEPIDGHFAPMNQLCKPCLLKYDIVGKMETFGLDVQYVLEHNNLTDMVEMDFDKEMFEKDTMTSSITNLFRKRSRIEKCIPFVDALQLLWRQLQIRGILGRHDYLSETLLSNVSLIRPDDVIKEAIFANRRASSRTKIRGKKSSMREAFMTISLEQLTEYRRLFQPDFELFGYDIEADNMFKKFHLKV